MSPSFMKKTMVYLGLLDDEYDEYDDLEDRAPRGRDSDRASAALGVRGHAMSKPPRPSASVFSAIGRLFGRSKDDADE